MSSALKISLTRIGNSRGIRLPAPLIKKFGFDGGILLEEEGDRLVLKPLKRGKAEKLPWSETAREMASAREDWSDWEPSEKDGLQEIPWESSDQRKSQP
jgi:antitoxin component of MazEF toxin-antitoxin module